MKNQKNGEMTSTQIITIVLLITGFVIILFVYSQFNVEDVDREVCHNSVVLRATLPDTFDLKELSPLKCKTRKVCITDKMIGKGDCENELGAEYETVRISKDSKQSETDINRFIANELADCWSMMGQGKVQIFTRGFFEGKTCSVCSRISFDEDLKIRLKKITGIGDFLYSTYIPNSKVSYLEFLTTPQIVENQKIDIGEFSTEEKAIVFIEVNEGSWDDWFFAIAGAISGGYVGAKTGAIIGSVVPGVGTTSLGIIGFVGGAAVGWFSDNPGEKKSEQYWNNWFLMDYSEEKFKELECNSLENIP